MAGFVAGMFRFGDTKAILHWLENDKVPEWACDSEAYTLFCIIETLMERRFGIDSEGTVPIRIQDGDVEIVAVHQVLNNAHPKVNQIIQVAQGGVTKYEIYSDISNTNLRRIIKKLLQ
jgi:hypothetical protein